MTEDQSAGATPVVPGATPGQTEPAADPAAPAAPATGAPQMATDEGKRALDVLRAELKAERAAAKAALAELETLRTGQLSEHEKAIAQARKDAQSETEATWSARLRASEVRRELQAAGISGSLELAARAPEFDGLEVGADGRVEGLEKAVAAFRTGNPYLFAKAPAAAGNFDGGAGGSSSGMAVYTADQVGDRDFYLKHEPDILRAMSEGRIRG